MLSLLLKAKLAVLLLLRLAGPLAIVVSGAIRSIWIGPKLTFDVLPAKSIVMPLIAAVTPSAFTTTSAGQVTIPDRPSLHMKCNVTF